MMCQITSTWKSQWNDSKYPSQYRAQTTKTTVIMLLFQPLANLREGLLVMMANDFDSADGNWVVQMIVVFSDFGW